MVRQCLTCDNKTTQEYLCATCQKKMSAVSILYDEDSRSGYISFKDNYAVSESLSIPDTSLVLDFDEKGTLVGIEFLKPEHVPNQLIG